MLSPRVQCSNCKKQNATGTKDLDQSELSDFVVLEQDIKDLRAKGLLNSLQFLAHQKRLQELEESDGQQPLPPLCGSCLTLLSDHLKNQTALSYLDHYIALENLVPIDSEILDTTDLDAEEAALRKEIEGLLEDSIMVRKGIAKAYKEAENLEKEESEYWKSFSQELSKQQFLYEQSEVYKVSVETQTNLSKTLSSRSMLQEFFVFDALHSKKVGTVNGLRLGKVSSTDPPWEEVNAALGHVALFISTIMKWARANKISTPDTGSLQLYRIQAIGSKSQLQLRSDPSQILPLYHDGGVKDQLIANLSWFASSFVDEAPFDRALSTFLSCVHEIRQVAKKRNPEFFEEKISEFYVIDSTNIKVVNNTKVTQSYSIKFHTNTHTNWTTALLLLLRILNQLLSWFQHVMFS